MAYNSIPDAWIEAGKPTKEEIFQRIKDNQESFNTDIEALKQTSTFDIFNFRVDGAINQYTTDQLQQFLPVFKAPVGISIVSFVITLLEASSGGVLQLALEKSTDDGITWVPLLSSPVEVTGNAIGSISGAVNFIDVASQSFNQNVLLRPTIIGLKTTQNAFHVSIYGEVS